MMRRMLYPMSLVMPRIGLLLALVGFGLAEGAYRIGRLAHYLRGNDPPAEVIEMGLAIPAFAFLLYGIWRGLGFHPVFWPDYRKWLLTVPWDSSKPLPLGPVHLAWQDAIVLAIAALPVLWHATTLPQAGLALCAATCAFAIAYLLFQIFSLLMLAEQAYAFVLLTGIGLAVFLFPSVVASAGILLVCCAIAAAGSRAALRRFPWQGIGEFTLIPRLVSDQVGWPLGELAPSQPEPRRRFVSWLLASCVIGWWIIAALWRPGILDWPVADYRILAMVVVIGLAGAAMKLILYLDGARWSMSFFGRLATRCLVIPDFDKILVGPICAMGASAAIWFACVLLQVSALFAATLCAAAYILIVGTMGPTLYEWRITGAVRLSAPTRATSKLERI